MVFCATRTESEYGTDVQLLRKSESAMLFSNFWNHFHILRLLMFYQIFLSPQVKRRVIIRNKHGMSQ